MTNQSEARERLLLALSVLSGRRMTALLGHELALIGIQTEEKVYYSDDLIKYKCEVLIAEAIIAGGYR